MTDDFSGFGLPAKLLQSLVRMQFKSPTPIQSAAIPLALEGRDILGSAQTGTGKTGAFGIPVIAKLIDNPQSAALIMTPTRELATQVMAALHQMIPIQTIRTALLIGGEPMPKQFRQLQAQPRLVVGTPGRIYDHLSRGGLRLNNVRFLVLDETDRMLDMGFGIQIEKIVAHVPAERQTMMFSATLPPGIVKLSSKYLNKPERISVGSTTEAPINIQQELLHVSDTEKYPKLIEQLKDSTKSVIVFVKTKYGTEKLAEKLMRQNYKAEAIHGDLRQSRRDRVIQNFRDKKFQILVATDLAARGLDVPHIELVINYDLPQCPEDYIHRIGRTARAGASGKAVNLLTPADRAKWRAIHMLMNPGAPAPSGGPKPARNENRPYKGRRDGSSFFGDKKRSGNDRDRNHAPSHRDGAARGAGEGPRASYSRDVNPRSTGSHEHKAGAHERPTASHGAHRDEATREHVKREPGQHSAAGARDGGKREGGFAKREGGFAGKREGGFAKREGGFGGKREGGFAKREGGFGGPKREGGFSAGPRDGLKREGSGGGRDGAKRDGGFGAKREGGFSGPKREGSFGRPKREAGEGAHHEHAKRDGAYDGPKRDGGFSAGPRDSIKRDGAHGPSKTSHHRDGAKQRTGGHGAGGGARDGAPRGGAKSSHGPRSHGPGQHRGRAAS